MSSTTNATPLSLPEENSTPHTGINDLPVELLGNIFQHLDFRDFKHLRLVNRKLSGYGSELCFKVVFIFLVPESMKKVDSIANHSTLGEYVRHLVCLGDRLCQHRSDIGRAVTVPKYEPYQEKKGREAAHGKFFDLSTVQQQLVCSSEKERLLTLLSSRFQGLDTHEIASDTMYDGFSSDHGSHDFTPFLTDLSRVTMVPEARLLVRDNSQMVLKKACLPTVLKALASSERSLQNLGMQVASFNFWSGPNPFYPQLQMVITPVLRAITKLDMSICLDHTEIGFSASASRRHLADFLSHCKALREVSMWFVPNSWLFGGRCEVNILFQEWNTSTLQVLYLRNISCTVPGFVDFVKRHATGLHTLELSNMELKTTTHSLNGLGAWEQAILDLAPITKLKYVLAAE
jgi:hypothetical protein